MAIGPRGNVLLGTDRGIAYRDNGRWRLIDRSVGISARQCRTVFVDHSLEGGCDLVWTRGSNQAARLPGMELWCRGRTAIVDQVFEVIAGVASSVMANYAGNVANPPLVAPFQGQAWSR